MKKTVLLVKVIFIGILTAALINLPAVTDYVKDKAEAESGQVKKPEIEEQAVEVQAVEEQMVILNEEPDAVSEQQIDKKLLLQEEQKDSYAYQQLSEREQTVYIEILWALSEFQDNVTLSSMDEEEITHMFQCVLNDHPEIFYVDGYTYTRYTLGEMLRKITFTGNYKLSREEIVKRQAQIDGYVDVCLAGLAPDADEYETVKYIYEYIINHTEYDASAQDSQNICSVFLDGKSVCQGYAKATQYLLKQAGISSTLVLGDVSDGEGHAWNLVQIDGEWYYVDTTWGDASYQAIGAGDSYPKKAMPTINYDYLCVTTNQLCTTHTIDNVVELPECTSMDANYYVREGLYFTTLDKEQLACIFKQGYEKGSAYVTLKCASAQLYEQMQEMLITQQNIFYYLDCPDGVVSYTDSEEQYSMSFWL
ncbi:MAG: hypothetical protein NC231_05045 [Bacillus sp. (in: Bacteria)]|nr:hypothetical protein [Bacillus sp. (in: firmicutes)]MCM1425112.1 hypothetical protein [Eubacterium sp.]